MGLWAMCPKCVHGREGIKFMPPKSVTPSIREIAFDCPHCGAYTTQTWYDLFARDRLTAGESRTPILPDKDLLETIRKDEHMKADLRESLIKLHERWLSGAASFDHALKMKNLRMT